MIKIFDRQMNYIGFLESFNSFSCSAKYADKGSFSIKTLLTDENRDLLQIGRFVLYKDFAGIIDSVQFSDIETDALTVNGLDLLGLLDKRIIWTNEYFHGKVEDFLRQLVLKNAISPTDPNRVIPFLTLGKVNGLTQITERNPQNEKLLDMSKKVCNAHECGIRITLDPREKKMEFEVYEGEDRSAGHPRQVIIGDAYDNVASHDYFYTNQKDVTTCLLASDTASVAVGETAKGFDRTEVFAKSSSLQDEMTSEQYQKQLINEAKDRLRTAIQCFDVDTGKRDLGLGLGDIVSIREDAWGISFSTRVTEKQVVVQNGVETVTYILGNDITTNMEENK